MPATPWAKSSAPLCVFFSSRRRHPRYWRDWSSDVCSSDLLPLALDLGDATRVTAAERYYVHVIATLGTLAEREVDDVGDAVFGRPSEANSLGSLGRRSEERRVGKEGRSRWWPYH